VNKDKKVLLVIYGEGGHRTEMLRLVSYLTATSPNFKVVSMGAEVIGSHVLEHFSVKDVRNKHSRLNILLLFYLSISALYTAIKISRKYRISSVISTGPGLCILPMLILRLVGAKIVFIETFCRFSSRSLSGMAMSKIAHRFYIQNEELQCLYPNAKYSGRL